MARKIIPLKYKKSPIKFTQNWASNTVAGLADLGTLGLFNFSSLGKTSLEGQFEEVKDRLIGTKVDQNFYKDLVNPYAGLTDQMASVEKKAEDLTVNQKQFEQQQRMLQRSLSATLEQSKQTGTQNVQAIANQLAQSSGDISASIGEQERQNQMLALKESSELDIRKAQSAQALDMQKAQGEFQVGMQIRKGEEDALSRQLNKEQAILGLLSGQIAREDQQRQQDKGWLTKILNIV